MSAYVHDAWYFEGGTPGSNVTLDALGCINAPFCLDGTVCVGYVCASRISQKIRP